MEGADAAPCFLERLSEAMLQWGWGLAAEIENGHLMYIYIYVQYYIQPPARLKREPSCFLLTATIFLSRVYAGVNS